MTERKRTILVTGASRGIGAAIRHRLTRSGHSVVGLAREPGLAAPGYEPVTLDLRELDRIDGVVREVLGRHPDLDVLVSNAGIPAFGNLEELSVAGIRGQIDLNLTSHVLVTRAVLPHLKTRGGGQVILMGSEAALRGSQRGSVYCAAKFGLRGFAQALRAECASSGVRVSIVHPGMVRTSFFDDLGFGPGDDADNAIEAEDVAEVVVTILAARPGTVVDEVSLSPQKKVVRQRPEARRRGREERR